MPLHHLGAYLKSVHLIVKWPLHCHCVYLWTVPIFHLNAWVFLSCRGSRWGPRLFPNGCKHLQTTYSQLWKSTKSPTFVVLRAAAWCPETNRLFRLHRPVSKDPIAFSKIWTISKAIIWQSTYFYMYNMLNVCRVRSLAAFCNGCFSFQFECNKSTASSGHVGPRHEASAAHRQTDAERDRHVFFTIDVVMIPTKPLGMDRAGRLLGVSTRKNAIAQD